MNPKLKTQNSKLKTISCSVLCLLFAVLGCQPVQKSKLGESTITLIEAAEFPPHMVGVWVNDSYGWGFKFEPDGRVSRLVHTIGRTELRAGQEATFPLIEEGTGVVVPGPWHVEYNGQTNELAVEIVLDSFSYRLSGNEIQGSSRDIFIGTIPESAAALWLAHWISYPVYIATTVTGDYVDYELPQKPGMEDKGEIIFEKLDLHTDQIK